MKEYLSKDRLVYLINSIMKRDTKGMPIHCDYNNSLVKVKEEIVLSPQEYPTTEWIKCTKKLPPVGESVLLYIPEDDMRTVGCRTEYDYYYICNSSGLKADINKVTHWQPLSKRPKK